MIYAVNLFKPNKMVAYVAYMKVNFQYRQIQLPIKTDHI